MGAIPLSIHLHINTQQHITLQNDIQHEINMQNDVQHNITLQNDIYHNITLQNDNNTLQYNIQYNNTQQKHQFAYSNSVWEWHSV